jgi:membrane protein implicated in regulation of membrane protease activity
MAWLWWIGAAFVLGTIEVATVDFTFLMFAVGALAGAGAAALGLTWWVCAIVFVVVSVGMLLLVRPLLLSHMQARGSGKPLTGAQALVGKRAETVTAVDADGGRVKLDGQVWTARTQDGSLIGRGIDVRVTAIDGATAIIQLEEPPQVL